MSLATILSLDISGFVFFCNHTFFLLFFCNCHHCFFTPTMIFAILSFLLIFVFPLSLFLIYLHLKSITDTCYGAPVGSLTVLPLPRFGPAHDADDEGLTEAGAAQRAAGPRVPLAAAAATFAAGASASTAAAGAAAATSAPGSSTFHDPGGHGPHSSSPPVYYEYQVCALHLASAFLI
jgi:hypothetical protein